MEEEGALQPKASPVAHAEPRGEATFSSHAPPCRTEEEQKVLWKEAHRRLSPSL